MSPPLSESDVRDREKWENIDERVEIDKLNTCDGKASNDLLYMYSLKDRAETGMDRSSCSGFPKLIQYEENISEQYTIKMHGKVTDNTKLAPIRLKAEEELLEKKERIKSSREWKKRSENRKETNISSLQDRSVLGYLIPCN